MSTIAELVRKGKRLRKVVRVLQSSPRTKFKGSQAADFDTTVLPQHGDYGYQTTDDEVQMNCNGVVRAITTAAL